MEVKGWLMFGGGWGLGGSGGMGWGGSCPGVVGYRVGRGQGGGGARGDGSLGLVRV